MSEHMNSKRAAWALMAVRAFESHCGNDGDQEAFGDLLGDMIHLCDAMKWDFDGEVSDAREAYVGDFEDGPKAKRKRVLAIADEEQLGLMRLVKDLWWSIENVTPEDPERTDKFFDLRGRVRSAI